MDQQPICVDVVISATQFRSFSLFDTFRRQRRWTRLALFAGILCAFGAVCFLKEGGAFLGLLLILIGLGLPAVYLFTFLSGVRNQGRIYRLGNGRSLYRVELTPAEDGIRALAAEGEPSVFRWADCPEAYRVDGFIYLYVSTGRALFLPAAYITGATPDALWAMMTEKLPAGKAKDLRKQASV